METIRNYLDNMFAGLPNTTRITDLKNNILSNMEEKYNELKKEGKSENEAIGIVISEFGNIDELMKELGIQKEIDINAQPIVNKEEVSTYLNVKRIMGLQVGIGVVLCILASATLMLISSLLSSDFSSTVAFSSNIGSILGLISLFVFVTAAVGIFIFSGMNFEKYKYMESGVQLPNFIKTELQQKYDSFTPTYYFSVILGVCLVILSPIAIFVTSLFGENISYLGVVILLVIVAISVFLFIYFGMIRESYSRLLRINDYVEKNRKEDKVIGAVAAIVWPLAVIIFLFCGFVYHQWSTSWIVFPITGILFGMFSAAYSIITGKNE